MKNPTISFRLTPYQLAKGLRSIRAFDPTYNPESLNKMVKTIFFDYINKFDNMQDLSIRQMDEITLLTPSKYLTHKNQAEKITLDTIIKKEKPTWLEESSVEETSKETDSTITSVTDFSPPPDWDNDPNN
ncbi:MAG TPA: hypothetical protein VJ878_04720 [Candidatus Izemoplasmatales bacterium]|nr:hypothetical protein [Candidatus Izemoplasmatales bacterium]